MPSESSSEPRAGRRLPSLARAITWGFWWRRVLGYVAFDLVLLGVVVALLVRGYNAQLPADSFVGWYTPTAGTEVRLDAPSSRLVSDLRYVVVSGTGTRAFPLGADLVATWPAFALVGLVQALSVLGAVGDTRRVRRELGPLNELALRAEEISRLGTGGSDKIGTLEQAIERASVDRPQVSTGDKDLASIEVALNGLLRRMQEAKLQQMRFVNDASHELRTPIAVVEGYVNLLDRWGKTDESVLDESILALKQESAHMRELVEQLLFLARGDSGRNEPRRERTDLAVLAAEVATESSLIDDAHRYLSSVGDGSGQDSPLVADVDAAMVKQCLRILVQNAAKYSAEGTTVTVGAARDGGSVRLWVADEGIGMDAEAASHAFDRFYRADGARESKVEGTGLGLSIARWIVERHGGSIEVVSREGVGSRFCVLLPAADDQASRA